MRPGGAGNGHIKSPSTSLNLTVFGVTVLPRLTSSKTLRRVFNRAFHRFCLISWCDLFTVILSIRIS